MSVYSNLTHKRKSKKDAESRKKAEYLASLPKHPVKRLFYRLHPSRFWAFWFSKKGAITALKVLGVGILFMVLVVGALFAYYRKDLDAIRPGELAKRVQTTVTRYEDRNGKLLWEDKGDGNYKLVVDGNNINKYMKEATVAIEDKDFYKHGGISVTGIFRSLINNANGGDVQGGSTLTQQLVKQVFFANDANKRGLNGVPRKIKEMILAVEVERMYDKEHILDLYLNESPYGGRRNGVESGSQTYFGKSSKDLTLPEAALLAGIPNEPGLYDPYYIPGHDALIARQHKVLDNMAQQGYITQNQADDAKKYPILDHIKPLSDQYKNIKAPHFVQMVRSQLETELGKATVGQGGLTVTTTLDLDIQNKLESDMNKMFSGGFGYATSPSFIGYSNGAATVEDVKTGQIVAMMGSRSFDYPGFGQDNAATSFIQPGSSIKPLVYAQLFQNQGAGKQNYGSGSILADDDTISGIYGATVHDADNKFLGSIPIRSSLTKSRNVPAIKAMYIAGKDATWKTIRDLGNKYYCTQGADSTAGLSSAIGGCGTREIDHVNAMASLARMGVYKPVSTVLKVTNSQGEVLKQFKDESKQVVDPQSAYIVNDILGDANARVQSHLYQSADGGTGTPISQSIGLKIAIKTGTSDKNDKPKDIWTIGYTPNLSMAMWLGNSDTSVLNLGYSFVPARLVDSTMAYASQLYEKENKGKISDWFTEPKGIQHINGELYPSWYVKGQAQSTVTFTFDKVSKKKATDCTPDGTKIDVAVIKSVDPITKKDVYQGTGGYDLSQNDDVHLCTDIKPTVSVAKPTSSGANTYTITVTATAGTHPLQSVDVMVNGTLVKTLPGSGSFDYSFADNSTQTITATVTDNVYYTGSGSTTFTPSSTSSGTSTSPVKTQGKNH
jgi:membrane peptidoglycan carboxypeptidase